MKKFLCILLACFMLASVPIHGYAAAVPTTFGVGVEVILPFLLSLLGVQSKNDINTYQELEAYHDEVYNELVDGLAGTVGTSVIENWLIRAASGIIDTDSVVWKKIYEYAIENYSSSSESGTNVDHTSGIGSFQFTMYQNTVLTATVSSSSGSYSITYSDAFLNLGNNTYLFASSSNVPYQVDSYFHDEFTSTYYPTSVGSYTYNNLTVYYAQHQYSGTMSPDTVVYDGSKPYRWMEKICWLMVYGGYVPPVSGDAAVSDSFSDVLSTSDKDDIVDGTSVIQLYNPSALQNGLEIIPGGDPDEDPNLRKIPFALTADWWNLLEQFGDDAVNQSVAAYNALNNIDDGTSTGSVSKAWEALGLGSVVGSAQNAEEGLIDLTDENIFPRSSTVQQVVTDNIPSSLVPEAPDSGIDNESEQGLYKLPDLRELFPFCIPFDLIDLLSKFVAEPETPEFAIALSTGYSTSTEEVDLHVVDSVASIVRTFELIGFVLALILITRNLIRG